MRERIFSATKKDFIIETFCTGGPGGQNQNKNQNGVRITHPLTGCSAESRVHKSQAQNKKAAFRKLCERILNYYRRFVPEAEACMGTAQVIRTYHAVRNEVKDHRTDVRQPYQRTLDGHLEPFIEACVADPVGQ